MSAPHSPRGVHLLVLLVLPALLGAASGCSPGSREHEISWTPVDSLNDRLPRGIRVFSGENVHVPLRAWYVSLDPADPDVEARIVVSDDTDFREVGTSIAHDEGACVVVNGGYFRMDTDPSRHVGLLVEESLVREPATNGVLRGPLRYPTMRAALGILPNGRAEISWVTSRNDTTWIWPEPAPNRPGLPSDPPDYSHAAPWPVRFAISGGPALIVGGHVRITSDEEVFFDTSIPDVHPRTAAGLTADGRLLLLVVDGRQPQSRGVDLDELATLMKEIGAVDALNLDGGGSSTLVVNGRLINRPSGAELEREIMSAIAVFCHDD